MARSSRKQLLEQQRHFSLKTWRKAEKRSTEIGKPGVLLPWFSPFCLQLFRLCHLLISPEENRDVDFDTFSEKLDLSWSERPDLPPPVSLLVWLRGILLGVGERG